MTNEQPVVPEQTWELTLTVKLGDKLQHELYVTKVSDVPPFLQITGDSRMLTNQMNVVMALLGEYDRKLF